MSQLNESLLVMLPDLLAMIGSLCAAATLGTISATSVSCGIGLLAGTDTWCSTWVWFVGFPLAWITAIAFGLPAYYIFRSIKLKRSWQFGLTGTLFAVPLWLLLAQPFNSARWQLVGLYDSINYLGTGLFAGLIFWWLTVRRAALRAEQSSKSP